MAFLVILSSLLSLLHLSTSATALSIGVNYGTLADNLPPPSQVASFLKQYTNIDRIKLFNVDPTILRAFANTNIAVTVTVGNGDIPALARLPAAQSWITTNISPFYPATNISYIAVGNEIIATADKNLIAHLLPAMRTLQNALKLAGMTNVRVSTPHSLGILSSSEPPSSGRFRRGYDRVIFAPMLDFHRKTKTPFMINPYPYFGFSEKTLNYALFKPNPGIFDAATGHNYTNMFDAQLDAIYSAMKRLGYGDVELLVAETGWPSLGDANQPAVNMENAISYNGNLIRHVNSGKGTPLMPGRKFETYIFALFNENLKPGSTAERNFGLFKPDLTPVYDVGVMRAEAPTNPTTPTGSGSKWCVPKPGVSVQALQANIDYVCSTGLDCSPIQSGGPCFTPDTIESHAAYAMNAYYQSNGRNDFNCDFAQTGTVVTSDPSYGTCKYSS
ncbi:glucan endo-1,3-beta-glucosidase-like isoform X1 [Magnolia sinica]|uniref:glucan endo-1,3-beta-glucosidase-like isoform X1 n=1 Tax=Magnolia sinica TaxID=86752 RepID=UPI002658C5D5|nr:glucan endo-1,3-beta-glucosidase-like isoform X1 [Magnolia sinica]